MVSGQSKMSLLDIKYQMLLILSSFQGTEGSNLNSYFLTFFLVQWDWTPLVPIQNKFFWYQMTGSFHFKCFSRVLKGSNLTVLKKKEGNSLFLNNFPFCINYLKINYCLFFSIVRLDPFSTLEKDLKWKEHVIWYQKNLFSIGTKGVQSHCTILYKNFHLIFFLIFWFFKKLHLFAEELIRVKWRH